MAGTRGPGAAGWRFPTPPPATAMMQSSIPATAPHKGWWPGEAAAIMSWPAATSVVVCLVVRLAVAVGHQLVGPGDADRRQDEHAVDDGLPQHAFLGQHRAAGDTDVGGGHAHLLRRAQRDTAQRTAGDEGLQ